MIEKLKIKNFKSHEDSEIDFTPGLNIFLGEVGAGKTSILEAISFALFGKYAGNINQNGLIRRGAEKAEISLIFSTTTGRYKIERMISVKKIQKPKMSVYDGKEWMLAVDGATAVSKSVEDFLNVDASTFLAAIYASQSEIKEMLETQPGKRRERLDKLLGIDMYEKIWKTLGEAEHIVLKELTDIQEKASGVNVYERQLKIIRSRINSSKKELKALKNSLSDIDKKLKPTAKQLKSLNLLKQELTRVNIQIEGKIDEIEKSKETILLLRHKKKKAEKASTIFEKNKRFINLENNLRDEQKRVEIALQKRTSVMNLLLRDKRDLQQETESQNKLLTQLKGFNILEKEFKIFELERKPLLTLRNEQTLLQYGVDALQAKLIKASSDIDNQKRKKHRVVELGECPTCFQVVPEKHKERIRRETSQTITKLESEYSSFKSSKEKESQQLVELKRKIERADAADRKYFEIRIKIQMLKDRQEELKYLEYRIEQIKKSITKNNNKMIEIKETSQTLTKINTKLEVVIQKSNLAREAELQSAAKSEFETILQQEESKRKERNIQLITYQKLQKKLTDKYNAEEHETIERNVIVLRENRAKIIEGISRLEKTLKDDQQQDKRTNNLLDEKRKAKREVNSLKNESNIIDTLRQSLRQVIQPIMRKNNILKVSEAFQRFYQELSNDIIDSASIDEDGNIDITRNGEPSPINSLSGGETTCAALALRLAISSSLTNNQLLLLDEPTIHLDESYRAKLRDFLGDHRFEQLIVVTHDNTFDSLPAKIFRVQKKMGDSDVLPLKFGGV